MPAKITKKDDLKEFYRPPSTIELLSKLAEEMPYGVDVYGYPKKAEAEPGLKEPLYDPIPTPPVGKMAKLAISLPFAIKQIQKIPLKGLSPNKLQEVEEAIKLLKAVPKRALQTVSNLEVEKPETFKEAAALLGSWGTRERDIFVSPIVKSKDLPPSFQKFLQSIETGKVGYTLPETIGHELGHEISERLLQKRGKSLFTELPKLKTDIYSKEPTLWEGVAEYLGYNLGKKAGISYTPKFSYGPEQKLVFDVLSTYPSKNPYMNVYRFLQKSGELGGK